MERPIDLRVGGESECVPAGRYLAYIAQATRMKSQAKGTHGVKLETVVRTADGKHDVHFFIYWQRKDGTRIRRGCEVLSAIAKHGGLPNHEVFHPEKLKGKVVVLALDVESTPPHDDRNTIESVHPAAQSPTGDYVDPSAFGMSDARPVDPPREPADDDGDDESDIPF